MVKLRVNWPAGSVLPELPALELLFVAPVPSLVVTVALMSGVAAEPNPVVPTAQSWMVAPVTGCCPPCTEPVALTAAG